MNVIGKKEGWKVVILGNVEAKMDTLRQNGWKPKRLDKQFQQLNTFLCIAEKNVAISDRSIAVAMNGVSSAIACVLACVNAFFPELYHQHSFPALLECKRTLGGIC